MAVLKKLVLKCTGTSLLADGRVQVTFVKPAEAETSKTASGASVVNPNEATLTIIATPPESDSYAPGREFSVTLSPVTG